MESKHNGDSDVCSIRSGELVQASKIKTKGFNIMINMDQTETPLELWMIALKSRFGHAP